MAEWRRQEADYFTSLIGGDLFSCPACSSNPHCVHIDGNMKLYRYNRASRVRCVQLLLQFKALQVHRKRYFIVIFHEILEITNML